MTGSGKTGLCLDLLEEAALNNVPAIMIDPKGDITNALLHFPELRPADFQPWINPDEARREGKTLEQAAADTAALWRDGLAQWDITPDRLRQLKESVRFAVYTPGSDAGLPVSILASLEAPAIDWQDNRELLREKISGTVTALLGLVGIEEKVGVPVDLPGTSAQPAVPGRVGEYFLMNDMTLSQAAQEEKFDVPGTARSLGLLYQPVLLAQAEGRVQNRKYSLDHVFKCTAIVPEPDRCGAINWKMYATGPINSSHLDNAPVTGARFSTLDEPLSDEKVVRSMEGDFADWIYRETQVPVKVNKTLGVYVGPDVSEEAFLQMCREAAEAKGKAEADKLNEKYKRQRDSLEARLAREERKLEEDKAEYNRRKLEEGATHVETIIGLFSKRRRSVSSSMSKRRMTARAGEDVEESEQEIARLKEEIEELDAERKRALDELDAKWGEIARQSDEIKVSPYKKDITIEYFGVAWMPHHLLQFDGRTKLLAGFNIPEN